MGTMKTSIVAMVLFAGAAAAATNDVPVVPDPLHTSQADLWRYGIAVVTPLLIALVKWGVPKIPGLVILSVAPFVGVVIGVALNAVSSANLAWVDSAQLGALGVYIRELVDQSVKLRQQNKPYEVEIK